MGTRTIARLFIIIKRFGHVDIAIDSIEDRYRIALISADQELDAPLLVITIY